MTDSTPTRRSARGQVRNKKYNFDTFEVLNIIGSDSEPSSGTPPKLDTSDDEEFPGDAIVDESDLDDDIASASNPHSDRSGNATPEGEYESPTRDSNTDLLDPGMVPPSFRFLHRHIGVNNERESKQSKPVEGQHSRGLPHYDSHQSKYAQIKYLIGTNPEDLHDFTQAIDKWARDATLPTRIPNEQGCGGMSFPFVHDLQKRLANPLTESKWRYSINHEQGSKTDQKTRILDATHGSKYLPKGHARYSFLMGPYGNQKLYTLSAQETSSINRYWRPTTSSESNEQDGRDMSSFRNGWLLNAGSEIQSLAWAPNKPGGSQYLAIATTHAEPADRKLHSAFQPSSSYPACINLWRFQVSAESDHKKSNMDMGVEPHIVQTICTNWGAVKQIRWCPASRGSQYEEETTAFVGLLAGIWSDGCIRVLAIKLDEHQKSSAIYGTSPFVCCELEWLLMNK
jgi:transcription factor C subunit 6